jgi:hypothetical protein
MDAKAEFRQSEVEGAAVSTQDCHYESLIAAGVVLCGNQNLYARACFRLLPRLGSERVQDTDDGRISSENTQANGCDDGNEEYGGH